MNSRRAVTGDAGPIAPEREPNGARAGIGRGLRLGTTAVLIVALGLVLAAFILEGSAGAGAPVAFALLFTLPGNLVRRLILPHWRFDGVESVAIDLVVSSQDRSPS